MKLTDEQIDALVIKVEELTDRAWEAWDHHPDEVLGDLANAFVGNLSRADLLALAGQYVVDQLHVACEDDEEEPVGLLN